MEDDEIRTAAIQAAAHLYHREERWQVEAVLAAAADFEHYIKTGEWG